MLNIAANRYQPIYFLSTSALKLRVLPLMNDHSSGGNNQKDK